jgi:hypothetical protein
MSAANPWLEEWPWPDKKMPRDALYTRIEHLLVMANIGVLSTSGKNGPIGSPVEYTAEGLTIFLYPQPGSPKLAAIERDPRVCFAVHASVGNWVSCRGAQLFAEAQMLQPGTQAWEHGMAVLPWEANAVELGRDRNSPPNDPIMRIEPDRVVYTEHWMRRDGYAPRQIWRRDPPNQA